VRLVAADARLDRHVDHPGLTFREHRELAQALLDAARERRPIAPLTERHPDITLGDATRIRDALLAARILEGERPIGAKVSLDRPRIGRVPGAHEPRFGWLTDGMLLTSAVASVDDLIHPRVEPRLAFVLAQPLDGPIVSIGKVLAAAAEIRPCLEITDSRYVDSRALPIDEVADNCGAASLLVGDAVPVPAEGNLQALRVQVAVDVDGRPSSRGRDPFVAAPFGAIAWLASQMVQARGVVESGTLLLSPALGTSVALHPGMRLDARFGALGELSLSAR
jgi:2-oxopent-4-enoate/cis-2-oxohex-4-enoate hydratase